MIRHGRPILLALALAASAVWAPTLAPYDTAAGASACDTGGVHVHGSAAQPLAPALASTSSGGGWLTLQPERTGSGPEGGPRPCALLSARPIPSMGTPPAGATRPFAAGPRPPFGLLGLIAVPANAPPRS